MAWRNFIAGLGFISLVACNGGGSSNTDYQSSQKEPSFGDWVVIHMANDPDRLNPTNSRMVGATYIKALMHTTLLYQNPSDGNNYPYLAKALPEISADGMRMTFEICNEATWDDGKPITAEDVVTTFKILLNPKVDAAHLRGYFDFLSDIEIDKTNPKKFTFVANRKYFRALYDLSQTYILPKHIYDKEGIMDKFSIKELQTNAEVLAKNPDIQKLADQYNDDKFSRERGYVVGGGPYLFVNWTQNTQVELRRKPQWWGYKMKGTQFEAYPEKIIYRVNKDQQVAGINLQKEELDVMHTIRARTFAELKDKEKIKQHFNISTPPDLSYSFLGMNCKPGSNGRNPALADKNVRKALAHLLDVDKIIEKLMNGLAERTVGPILKYHKEAYNDKLTAIPFDVKKATDLLDAAGWKDSDGDGVRDKMLNGKKIPLELDLKFNRENEERKNIGLIFSESAKQAGVKIVVTPLDISEYRKAIENHDFDIFYGGWISPNKDTDLKQIWHTSSWKDKGSNYVGFGNAESDKLIDQLRQELDPQKRYGMYKKFQEMVYEDQPYIFLMMPKERIIIHKRFRNSETHSVRPGFDPNRFWTPKEFVKHSAELKD